MSILVELPEDQYASKVFANFGPLAEFKLNTACRARTACWPQCRTQ
jgi:hypothetical protein